MPRQLFVCGLLCLLATPLHAEIRQYKLHNHPDNIMGPPLYGLRLDDLLESGIYTFDFDHADASGKATMLLEYDDKAHTIHIWGRAYGGKDDGVAYDPKQSGWVDIDFTYRSNIIEADNRLGDYGDDLFVLGTDVTNSGVIELSGWGGDQTIALGDKSNSLYCFEFDNDFDHKWNASFANNPLIWSGTGWILTPAPITGIGSHDWSFWAEEFIGVPVEQKTWTDLKRLYAH